MAYPMRIAEDKEQAAYLPPPKKFKKDTFADEDIYKELIVAKAALLKEFPFWGILGMTIRLVEINDKALPTLATDGMHVFYNPEFIRELSKSERVFALAHELFHGLYEHAGPASRAESYLGINMPRLLEEGDAEKIEEAKKKLKLWNFAADFVVNTGLVEANVGEFIKTIPILYEDKYIGWSVEEVYDDLLENPEMIPPQAQCLDQHIEIEVVPDDQMRDGDGNKKPHAVNENGKTKVRMSQSEYNKLAREWRDSMASAAAAQKEHDQREGGAGCIPAAIQRMIDELAKPKINWRLALRRFVTAVQSYNYSYARPNKALFHQGWSMPGFRSTENELDAVLMFDTSGSISQEQLTAFVSEFKGIMDSFQHYNIHAWCFDGEVQLDSVVQLTRHGQHGENPWSHVEKFAERISGGGGTNFMVNWEYMSEQRMKPRVIIMLTDGMPFGGWGDPMGPPTMFFIMGNQGVKAPFGMTIHYEDA